VFWYVPQGDFVCRGTVIEVLASSSTSRAGTYTDDGEWRIQYRVKTVANDSIGVRDESELHRDALDAFPELVEQAPDAAEA
jgi:hypothetical protein